MSKLEEVLNAANRAAQGSGVRVGLSGGGSAAFQAAEAGLDARAALPAAGGMTLLKGGAILAGIGLAGWAAASLFSRPSWTQRIEDERAASQYVHR
jgi:hypothetical protein